MSLPWWVPETGLYVFHTIEEMWYWVEHNASGEVGVVHGNARLLANPICRGDMRVLEIYVTPSKTMRVGSWV